MSKRPLGHRARDQLREANDRPRRFVPTLAVERTVILGDEQARAYKSSANEQGRRKLGEKGWRRYHLRTPDDLKLVVVPASAFIGQLSVAPNRVDANQMLRLAELLRDRLEELLAGTPSGLVLPLGKITCFEEANPKNSTRPKQIVGVEPLGWRGPRAHYGEDPQATPLSLLASESQICQSVISTVHEDIDPRAWVCEPHIGLIERSHQIPLHDLIGLKQGMDVALPDEFTVSDPVITLRSGSQRALIEQLPVRQAA